MLSIVVVAFDMVRELPRTLTSLSTPYQRGIDREDVELIIVDNGSAVPVTEAAAVAVEVPHRIVRIDDEYRTSDVYDLEVDRSHNYVANRVVVHNSIYKFRGAAISNVLSFVARYPDAPRIVLTENYRSHQAILDAAYRLIRYNDPDRLEAKDPEVSKQLVASREPPGGVKPPERRAQTPCWMSSTLYPSGSVTNAITVLPPLTGPGSRVIAPPPERMRSQVA